jgi:hypothetical protein
MGLLRRGKNEARSYSLDEFVDGGEERDATPLNLASGSGGTKDWQKKLASIAKTETLPAQSELALPAFTLVRGGDLFERAPGVRKRTEPQLLDLYVEARMKLVMNGAAQPERDTALGGVLRVLAGNPALAKRMLLAKPVHLVIIPKGRDFREFEFPRSTNPHAAGIFWNTAKEERALLGLREELIVEKSYLMVHEMTHAVHFLAFTEKERRAIDQMLMPVYLSRRWVEEAVAIYAECAFGAEYADDDLRAPGLYGRTRREWNERHVFARFMDELMRPPGRKPVP